LKQLVVELADEEPELLVVDGMHGMAKNTALL
jgi:hypothetical protein